mgnify:CR=1 FL=1
MGQPLQQRIESNWEHLKDKVKESLDKVVEAVGTYPAAPDDMGVIPVAGMVPAVAAPKRKAARKSPPKKTARAVAKRATTASLRTPAAAGKKRAVKTASRTAVRARKSR